MRVSKVLGSLVAVGAAVVAIATTTESRAGGDEELVKITRAWLPVGWTSTEQVGGDGKSRTFLAQDGLTGALITWAYAGTRVYLLVKRAPV